MTQVARIKNLLFKSAIYIKVDEERKVGAVKELYQQVSGDFTTVKRLQLLSECYCNLFGNRFC